MPENHYIDHIAGYELKNFCPGLPLRRSVSLKFRKCTLAGPSHRMTKHVKIAWVFTGGGGRGGGGGGNKQTKNPWPIAVRFLFLFGCLLKSPNSLSQKNNSATGTRFSLINYLGMGTLAVCNLSCKKAVVLVYVYLFGYIVVG